MAVTPPKGGNIVLTYAEDNILLMGKRSANQLDNVDLVIHYLRKRKVGV